MAAVKKRVVSGPEKPKAKGKHHEWDFDAVGDDGSRFRVYLRQNTILADDFSCGIRWDMNDGESLTLARYNGSSHGHPNVIEETRLPPTFHIHRATARYIAAGRQPEGFAEESALYTDLSGAVRLLASQFNVSGLEGMYESPKGQTGLPWV